MRSGPCTRNVFMAIFKGMNYPSVQKGQIYVPSMNLILFIGCIMVLALFKTSENMEHA